MISAYSFVMALIFFNMAMIIAYVLRRKRDFVAKYGIQTVITIVVFGLLRLLLPVGIEEAYVIGSTKFVPAVQTALNYGIAGTDFSLGEALLALWALGAIVFIAKDIVTIVCFKRERAKYGHCECAAVFEAADELKINNKITVTPDAPVPYVAGYLKQEIFLPYLELNKDEWKSVLMHEQQHIKRTVKLTEVVSNFHDDDDVDCFCD